MKTMRLLMLSFFLLAVSAAFAQGKHHPGKAKSDSLFKQMSERLKLTAGQQAQLKETMKQNRAELKAVREANKDAAKEEKRKAAAAQLKKNDERIAALLNADQQAEYEKIKAEKREALKKKREEHRRHKDDSGSTDELDDELL